MYIKHVNHVIYKYVICCRWSMVVNSRMVINNLIDTTMDMFDTIRWFRQFGL